MNLHRYVVTIFYFSKISYCKYKQRRAINFFSWINYFLLTRHTPAGMQTREPSTFLPSRCRAPKTAACCLWTQGLTQGLNQPSLKQCTWEVAYCVIVKTMSFTGRHPKHWILQNLVCSNSRTVKMCKFKSWFLWGTMQRSPEALMPYLTWPSEGSV